MAKKKLNVEISVQQVAIVAMIAERNSLFNTMVANQDKATIYRKLAKEFERKNKDLAGFVNSLDRRILVESNYDPNLKVD